MENLRETWLARVASAPDAAALEEVRLAALGKKGEIALKMRELGQMSPEERQQVAPALNRLRDEVDAALKARRWRWRMRRWTSACAPNGWT